MSLQESYTPTKTNLNDQLPPEERELVVLGGYVDHGGVAIIPTKGFQSGVLKMRYGITSKESRV